jgi:hypothetical protein
MGRAWLIDRHGCAGGTLRGFNLTNVNAAISATRSSTNDVGMSVEGTAASGMTANVTVTGNTIDNNNTGVSATNFGTVTGGGFTNNPSPERFG